MQMPVPSPSKDTDNSCIFPGKHAHCKCSPSSFGEENPLVSTSSFLTCGISMGNLFSSFELETLDSVPRLGDGGGASEEAEVEVEGDGI